jgi:hypothetical protein
LNLQHSETDLCTLERGFFRNLLSETPLSLKLRTFLQKYGFEEANEMGVFGPSDELRV